MKQLIQKSTIILSLGLIFSPISWAEKAAEVVVKPDPRKCFFEKSPGDPLKGHKVCNNKHAANKFGEIKLFPDEDLIHVTYDDDGKPNQLFIMNRTGEILTGGVVYGKHGEDPKSRYKLADIRLDKNETFVGITTKETGWIDRIFVINDSGEIYTGGAVVGTDDINPRKREYYGKAPLEKGDQILQKEFNSNGALITLYTLGKDGEVAKNTVENENVKTSKREKIGKIQFSKTDTWIKTVSNKTTHDVEQIYTLNSAGEISIHNVKEARAPAANATQVGGAIKTNTTLTHFSEAMEEPDHGFDGVYYVSKKGEILAQELNR